MTCRTVMIEWSGGGGIDCVGCGAYIWHQPEFQTWTDSFTWIGCYCAECVKKLVVIYECYQEVKNEYGKAIYYDMETIRRIRPAVLPMLEKI